MDRDSISKPVLSNLEISSNTVGGGGKNRHSYDTHAKTYYIYFKMNLQLLHKTLHAEITYLPSIVSRTAFRFAFAALAIVMDDYS